MICLSETTGRYELDQRKQSQARAVNVDSTMGSARVVRYNAIQEGSSMNNQEVLNGGWKLSSLLLKELSL